MSPRESQAERLERERRELADDVGATSPELYRDKDKADRERARKRGRAEGIRHGLRMAIDDRVRQRIAEADEAAGP